MEIVPFEIAKKLKEKGFTLPKSNVIGKFDSDGVFHSQLYINFTETMDSEEIIAPTISQVLKWLRGKDIMVEIPVDLGDNGIWQFTFRIQTKKFYERATKCDYVSYESAALSCIEYIIDNDLI